MIHRILVHGVAWAVLGLLAGCTGQASSDLAPVRGKVSYLGKPLPSGTIVFAPDAQRGTSGPLARAEIQSDGTYQLKCGETAGAVAGWHRVTVVAVIDDPSPSLQRPTTPYSLLPARYRDPELSGLTCEVKPGKDNTINFNLE